MRHRILAAFLGLSVLLAAGSNVTQAADSDTISVALKTFKFKVKDELAQLYGYNSDEEKLFYFSNGSAEAVVKITADGEYEILVKASCDPAQNERAKFKLAVDGEAVGKETLLTADEEKEYKFTAKLKQGERKLSIEFTNDVYKENEFDRNFFVHAVTLKRAK